MLLQKLMILNFKHDAAKRRAVKKHSNAISKKYSIEKKNTSYTDQLNRAVLNPDNKEI